MVLPFSVAWLVSVLAAVVGGLGLLAVACGTILHIDPDDLDTPTTPDGGGEGGSASEAGERSAAT